MNMGRLFSQLTDPIKTNEGNVVGELLKTYKGNIFKGFFGIPYAKPPLGSLRFLPPVKAECRKKTYIAKKKNIKCYQDESSFGESEDCLYLNIYVPEIKTLNIPVMVFFHGGAFKKGNAGKDVYGPDYIIENDVILVTVNHRLGVFGFMTLACDVAPGNLGLRDQVLAMKWIKSNITYFGGNNEKITIFGQSAGSMACMYHLVSPLSQGLFSQIIAQSGVFWGYCHLNTFASDNGRCLAERLGFECNNKSNQEILTYLQNEDPKKIQAAALSFSKDDTFTIDKYVPRVDDYCKDPFMPKDGFTLLREGNYNKVPIIIGNCKDEGLFLSYMYNSMDRAFDKMNENWNRVGSLEIFNLPYDIDNVHIVECVHRIREFYFGHLPFGFDNYEKHSKMSGDQIFDSQCHLACLILSEISDLPIYRYRFDHEGKHSLLSYLALPSAKLAAKAVLKLTTGLDIFKKFKPGVNHADDLNFVFRIACFNADETENDIIVKDHITTMWTNFAKNGKPTLGDEWGRFCSSDPYKQYIISSKPGMSEYESDYINRMNFWINEVYPVFESQSRSSVYAHLPSTQTI